MMRRWAGLLLISPALAVIGVFFLVPLGLSFVTSLQAKGGGWTLAHFEKSFELYTTDMLYTVAIVLLSSALIAVVAIAIAGYLTLGEHERTRNLLRWLYRWPLFIPFIVTGQVMRTFLAKNGMLNHVLVGGGLIDPLAAQSLLDWRGIVIAFVWKQAPFVTLAGRRDGLNRRSAQRGRAQPRRAALARAARDCAAAGARHPARRGGAFVRDHAVGAVGTADDQPELADDDDGGCRLSHQQPWRLRGSQRAVPDVAAVRLARRLYIATGSERAVDT